MESVPVTDSATIEEPQKEPAMTAHMEDTQPAQKGVTDSREQPADIAPSSEDFTPGMEVTFNRTAASPSSCDRIPASVTRGKVVRAGISTVLVQWEGLEQAQHHTVEDLELLS